MQGGQTLTVRKMQIKTKMRHQIKQCKTVGKDVEQLELSYMANRCMKWCCLFAEQFGSFFKLSICFL